MMLTYSDPFPANLPSLDGCLELERPREEGAKAYAATTTDMNGFPILYRTLLSSPTSKMCNDTSGHMKRLDRECHLIDPSLKICKRDQYTRLLGRKVCDFYEDQHGIFLAECDCLNRDKIPTLSSVVEACRQRARAEDQRVREWEANPPARGLAPVRTLGTEADPEERCDMLERNQAMPPEQATDQNDLFTHLAGRYIIRSAWKNEMETALDLEDKPPSPYCVYAPCRLPDSSSFYVPYSEYQDAVDNCPVERCQVNIIRRGLSATGRTSIQNNVFNINCEGKACEPDEETKARVAKEIEEARVRELMGTTTGEAGSGGGSGDDVDAYKVSSEDLRARCGKFGNCMPNGRCKCVDGWTGETCRQRSRPDPVIIEPSSPPPIDKKDPAIVKALLEEKDGKEKSSIPTWLWIAAAVFAFVLLPMALYVVLSPTPKVIRIVRRQKGTTG
jgi:hypothetical protein